MVTFSKSNTVTYIEKIGDTKIERKGTRRNERGSPIRKEIVPVRYWTYKDAKTFLVENGFADFLENHSVQKLARLIEGHVRRRAHEKNVWEKLEDFQSLLEQENTTLGDLRQVILSGGR